MQWTLHARTARHLPITIICSFTQLTGPQWSSCSAVQWEPQIPDPLASLLLSLSLSSAVQPDPYSVQSLLAERCDVTGRWPVHFLRRIPRSDILRNTPNRIGWHCLAVPIGKSPAMKAPGPRTHAGLEYSSFSDLAIQLWFLKSRASKHKVAVAHVRVMPPSFRRVRVFRSILSS